MNKTVRSAIALILFATGCSTMPAGEKREPATSLNPMFTVQTQNRFGTKLMHEAFVKDGSSVQAKNIMTSPISAQMAFSIVLNGAGGSTRSNLLSALEVRFADSDQIIEQVNQSNKMLQDAVAIERSEPAVQGKTNPPMVRIANSLWNTNGATDGSKFEFAQEFLAAVQKPYNAEYSPSVNRVDFQQKAGPDAINAWVSEKTNKLIPTIINLDALKPMLWTVINATYFESSWAVPFAPSHRADKFTLLNGTQEDRAMIENTGSYLYLKNGETEIVEVPFAKKKDDDREYVFYAILPREATNFVDFQNNVLWKSDFVDHVISDMRNAQGSRMLLVMPKFEFDYSVEMRANDALTHAMGLDFLFSRTVDLSKMGAKGSLPSKVGLVKQSTRIELDEFGVKAAAVTLIGGLKSLALPAAPPVSVIFNRPFAYAIVEKKSSAVLFLGSVVNPVSKPKAAQK